MGGDSIRILNCQAPATTSYPKPIGIPFHYAPAAPGRFNLHDFHVIDGPGEDCLVILQGGGWGRIAKRALAAIQEIHNLTPATAALEFDLPAERLRELLNDAVEWGMLQPPNSPINPVKLKLWNEEFGLLVLKVTNVCNIDCRYCYNAGVDDGGTMTPETGFEVVRRAIDFSPHGLNIVFHGGEPFVKLDLMTELCGFAHTYAVKQKKKVSFSVQTNGTVLTDAALNLIEQYHIGVGISLDGPGSLNALRVTHAGRPTVDKTWRGIEELRSRGQPINVITVITSHNASFLYEIVLAFQKHGFSSVKFSPLLRQGYASSAPNAMNANPEDIASSFVRIIDGISDGSIHSIMVSDICDMINRCLSWGEPTMCHRGGPCGAGKDMLSAFPRGDIYPCDCLVNARFKLGRLDGTNSLHDLVKGPIVASLDRRRPEVLQPCSQCAFQKMCGGTMTCRAFWSNGEIATVDAAECEVNQRTIEYLLWRLTDSRRLVEYFLHWKRREGSPENSP